MKYVGRAVNVLLLLAAVNALPLVWFFYSVAQASPNSGWLYLPLLAVFLYVNTRPLPKRGPTKRIQRLAEGCELLWLFGVTVTVTVRRRLRQRVDGAGGGV